MTSMPDTSSRMRLMAQLFGASSAMALAVLPQAAWAQDDQPQPAAEAAENGEGETIVVTGFRASLQAALGAKRNETGITDTIVAEDIADFPDQNLAESLQRIPGVSIDRDAGEGRTVIARPRLGFHSHPPQPA
jgi:iron complex outermembrane recepter protein